MYQYFSGNSKGHQGGKSGLQLVQFRGRPAGRGPTQAGLSTTAASAQKPRKLHPRLAEQRGNPTRPPILYMASPAAGPAIRSQRRVAVGLRGNDALLNPRQQQLPFGQR